MEDGLPGTSTRRTFLSAIGGSTLLYAAETPKTVWSVAADGFLFEWDFASDRASVRAAEAPGPLWRGGLLPGLLVERANKSQTYLKAVVDVEKSVHDSSGGRLALAFSSHARGELEFKATPAGFDIVAFEITWLSQPLPIVCLYFGTALLSAEEKAAAPVLDQEFWPNWDSAGFAVPGAKGAPLQSVFRRWDLGNARLPLGSFGPSLGTPYAAAYPRPLYAAALGDDTGWVCAGAGSVSDGALCLTVQSSSACLSILYREDLWGGPSAQHRSWESPLRLAWAADPWHAYQKYFASFDSVRPAPPVSLRPQWNSWGDFRKGIYRLREFADWTKSLGAEILGIDDRWESFTGSGEPNLERFPQFDEDIRYIQSIGLRPGFWQPVGWVDRPAEAGLSPNDLVTGPDGAPRRMSWDVNPRARGHYCLDPSSSRTVEFLRRRTVRLMERYRPALLKLDFGYGLPSPHAGVPRGPLLRGERFSFRLIEIIAEAARSVDRDVAIEYYSLHPLWRSVVNVVALDDLGDAGHEEADGHGQWSIWSALAGGGASIMASSGYDWNADGEVVLNSAVIGVPGAVLSRTMEDGSAVPAVYINRRMALNRWYRRTSNWSPLWLNSSPGGLLRDPRMYSFGRLERIGITALALREANKHSIAADAVKGMLWNGSWAVIAQDDLDVFRTNTLACIPVGGIMLDMPRTAHPKRVLAITRSGEHAWRDWRWDHGRLRLNAPSAIDELLGFLVLSS